MATAQKTTAPAKMATPAKPADPLAGLSVSVETAPLPAIQRNRDVVNPFMDAVKESFEDGNPRGVTVPEASVSRAVYMLRQAAERHNIGVRIVQDDAVNGQVKIRFQGKTKRNVTPRLQS